MTKITKKSINTLMDAYNRGESDIVLTITDPKNNDEAVMEISVKTDLTIPEKGIFVDRVVNACFDVDGDFLPQYLDPVFAITLLQMTTNVPVFEKEVKNTLLNDEEAPTSIKVIDIEKTYRLCKAINLVRNTDDERYKALVADLKGMVTAKLEYMKQVNSKKTANMLHVLQPMLESFQEILDRKSEVESLNESLKKIDEETDKFIQLPKEK